MDTVRRTIAESGKCWGNSLLFKEGLMLDLKEGAFLPSVIRISLFEYHYFCKSNQVLILSSKISVFISHCCVISHSCMSEGFSCTYMCALIHRNMHAQQSWMTSAKGAETLPGQNGSVKQTFNSTSIFSNKLNCAI